MKKDLSSLLKEVDALFVHSNRESRLCSFMLSADSRMAGHLL